MGDDRARKMRFFFVHFPSFLAHFLSHSPSSSGHQRDIGGNLLSVHAKEVLIQFIIHLCYSVVTH